MTNTIEECESAETLTERDSCYFEKATEHSDLSFCTQIIKAEKKNECINLVS